VHQKALSAQRPESFPSMVGNNDYQTGIGGGGFNFNAGLMQAAKVY